MICLLPLLVIKQDRTQLGSVVQDMSTLGKKQVSNAGIKFVISCPGHIAYFSDIVFGHILMTPVPGKVPAGVFQICSMHQAFAGKVWATEFYHQSFTCPKIIQRGEVVL